MNRTIVIGDIHGALRALKDLIRKINPDVKDRLIFLGDCVDGWSESSAVIDYLMALDKTHHCIFIKGNHDAWCEAWLKGEVADESWERNGGRETIESYKQLDSSKRSQHLYFFDHMLPYYEDNHNRLFVHAGFASLRGPDKERYASNFSWDRTLWEMALCVDDRLAKDDSRYPRRLALYKEIFIGHTPTTKYNETTPMQACNVWNVDTGAAFMGRISAMNIDTKEYWQSEACYVLYPLEQGRNRVKP